MLAILLLILGLRPFEIWRRYCIIWLPQWHSSHLQLLRAAAIWELICGDATSLEQTFKFSHSDLLFKKSTSTASATIQLVQYQFLLCFILFFLSLYNLEDNWQHQARVEKTGMNIQNLEKYNKIEPRSDSGVCLFDHQMLEMLMGFEVGRAIITGLCGV